MNVSLNPSNNPVSDVKELSNVLASKSSGLTLVKPKAIFKKIEDSYGEPVNMMLQVPSSGLGSLTLLEAAIMVSLLKITFPKRVFEFGTFLGYSTALLLRNTNEDCEVLSLDLEIEPDRFKHVEKFSEKELREDHISNDDYLRLTQSQQGTFYLSKVEPSLKQRLRLLKGDSRKFDSKKEGLLGNVDFVFVDGGHEYEIIKADTMNALKMIGDDGVIIWHDYNSKIHFEVTRYVQEISSTYNIIHIENTMFAICFVGSALRKLI